MIKTASGISSNIPHPFFSPLDSLRSEAIFREVECVPLDDERSDAVPSTTIERIGSKQMRGFDEDASAARIARRAARMRLSCVESRDGPPAYRYG